LRGGSPRWRLTTETAGHLDGLYGESLLTQAGYLRYGMHGLIRQYARGRAAAGAAVGRRRALERLLDYYQYSAARADALLAAESRTATLCSARYRSPSLPWQTASRP